MSDLDRRILEWVSGWPEQLAPTMVFFSTATNHFAVRALLALLIAGMVVRGGRARTAALLAVASFLLANETTDVVKGFWPANRPYQDGLPGLNDHLVGRSGNPGTASAHSANMAAVAFAFTFYLGRWGILWIAIAFLTGISRIYLGSHYPWQVLLGWMCGISAAFVVVMAWEAWRRWKAHPAEAPSAEEESA